MAVDANGNELPEAAPLPDAPPSGPLLNSVTGVGDTTANPDEQQRIHDAQISAITGPETPRDDELPSGVLTQPGTAPTTDFSADTPTVADAAQFDAPTVAEGGSFIDPNAMVQTQLEKLLAAGSPLQTLAENRSNAEAQKRGMLGSSMAIGAGQQALYDSALKIAEPYAATVSRVGEEEQRQTGVLQQTGFQGDIDSTITQQSAQNTLQQVGFQGNVDSELTRQQAEDALNLAGYQGDIQALLDVAQGKMQTGQIAQEGQIQSELSTQQSYERRVEQRDADLEAFRRISLQEGGLMDRLFTAESGLMDRLGIKNAAELDQLLQKDANTLERLGITEEGLMDRLNIQEREEMGRLLVQEGGLATRQSIQEGGLNSRLMLEELGLNSRLDEELDSREMVAEADRLAQNARHASQLINELNIADHKIAGSLVERLNQIDADAHEEYMKSSTAIISSWNNQIGTINQAADLSENDKRQMISAGRTMVENELDFLGSISGFGNEWNGGGGSADIGGGTIDDGGGSNNNTTTINNLGSMGTAMGEIWDGPPDFSPYDDAGGDGYY